MSSPSTAQPPASLARNRNFLLLWGAYAISGFGDHLSEMAILKSQGALEGDHATVVMARMTFLFFLPYVLFGPIAGLLADRLPRRMIMISADLVRASIMVSFAALMGWMAGWSQAWGPYLPLFLLGTFAAVFSPARFALLPTLVRPIQLTQANGLCSGAVIIASMAAYALGGVLAKHDLILTSFRIDAGTYVASAVLLALLVLPRGRQAQPRPAHAEAGPVQQVWQGMAYARRHRRVLELIGVAALVWFCGPVLTSVLPAVVRDSYLGNIEMVGYYRALFGVGFILGVALITWIGHALRAEIGITWGLLSVTASMVVFAASALVPTESTGVWPARLVGAAGVVGTGMGGVITMACYNGLLQRMVANRFRGRVFGLKDLASTGGTVLATGLLGVPNWPHLDAWAGWLLLGVALLTLAAGAFSLAVRLRRSPFSPILTTCLNFNGFLTRFWYRLERIGPPTVPRDGGVIVTANHGCSADPLLLISCAPYRPPSFMVAREYSNLPIARFFTNLIGCIPVNRTGQDTAATKQALRRLKAGNAMGIFIEGRLVAPGEVAEPRDGVALLALRSGAAVIPAHISGTNYSPSVAKGLLGRHRARVRFGPPVDLDDLRDAEDRRAALKTATARIYAAIQALRPTEAPDSGGQTAS